MGMSLALAATPPPPVPTRNGLPPALPSGSPVMTSTLGMTRVGQGQAHAGVSLLVGAAIGAVVGFFVMGPIGALVGAAVGAGAVTLINRRRAS